jgi:hypothetical protein
MAEVEDIQPKEQKYVFEAEPKASTDTTLQDNEKNLYRVHSQVIQAKMPVLRAIDVKDNIIILNYCRNVVARIIKWYFYDICDPEVIHFYDGYYLELWQCFVEYQIFIPPVVKKNLRYYIRQPECPFSLTKLLNMACRFQEPKLQRLGNEALLAKYKGTEIPNDVLKELDKQPLFDLINYIHTPQKRKCAICVQNQMYVEGEIVGETLDHYQIRYYSVLDDEVTSLLPKSEIKDVSLFQRMSDSCPKRARKILDSK